MKKGTLIEIAKQEGFDSVAGNSYTPSDADLDTWDLLDKNKEGLPRKNLDNLCKILENDPVYKALSYNVLNNRNTWNDEDIEDYHTMIIRRDIEVRYLLPRTSKDIADAVLMIAHNNQVDPIADYLHGLVWDGEERIDRLLTDVFMAETLQSSEDLISHMGVKFLISCVARVMRPGCKVDTCLVLVGGKGLGKSTVLQALAGKEYFSNSHIDIIGKGGYELIHTSGSWIWEIAEMHSLNGKDSNAAKMFLASESDTYRPSYGRFSVTRKRRVVFTATTNDFQFLSDGTERRFWPIHVEDKIDTAYIIENRDQIWAEAMARFESGEKWWLSDEDDESLDGYQAAYIIDDPWSTRILERLKQGHELNPVTTADLMIWVDLPSSQQHTGNSKRVCQICRDLGYKQIRKKSQRCWIKK